MEITNENTLTIVDMSKPTMHHSEALSRIYDAVDTLLEKIECPIQQENFIYSFRSIPKTDLRLILNSIYGTIFCHESKLLNIPESWDNPELLDKLEHSLKWFINNNQIPEE